MKLERESKVNMRSEEYIKGILRRLNGKRVLFADYGAEEFISKIRRKWKKMKTRFNFIN